MSTPEDVQARAEIRPVKEQVEDELLSRPGVTGVDINEKVTNGKGTGQMAIVVYVAEKKPKSALSEEEAIPEEINGIPTDVVEEEIVLHVAAQAIPEVELQVDATTYSTLQGGISIGPCRSVFLSPPDVPTAGNYIFVGTLGAMVTDRTSGAMMALTNFHVACVDSGWSVGDTQTQPGRPDGGSCPAGKFGAIVRAALSEHVDGAVISIDPGKSTACQIVDIGNVKGTVAAAVGMAVRKRGRTTMLTHGTVNSIDYTTSINYGNGLGVHTLKNQIRIAVDTSLSTQFGDHGDSGSVVVDAANKVLGLYFAGNTTGTIGVANPIQFVLDELDVNICTSGIVLVTKPVVCDHLVTRPVVCYLTRPVVCNLVTRPIICKRVTTPVICQVVTKPATCPIVTRICPQVTRACPGPGPGPFERPPAGPFAAGSDAGSWYGTPASSRDEASDAFWDGYYAALDAVAQAEEDAAEE
jgi:hypothetical protein